ncbi:MAG: S-layer homology domain-containing protein [Oscillospiraceae bacterium]|jgi:hypothetical protein|nr:S-layer homology domain-containing protein [Oscillospiraceae bacterium]
MRKRKILAICLAFAMAISMIPHVSAAQFSDVPASIGTMYLDAINYVTDNGIMNGTSATTFSPNSAVTRAMFVTILYRMSGETGTYNQANVFTDVSSSSYYYNAVGWAVSHGIVNGVTATTFEPNTSIQRQMLMTLLYRYAGYKGYPQDTDEVLTSAADYSSLSAYARTPMSWAYEYGIVARSFVTDSIFPTAVVDRKLATVFVARFIRNLQGIVNTRDAFSFRNRLGRFISGTNTPYYISASDWNRFILLALAEDVPLTTINTARSMQWYGSCFGMSVAAVLDYYGKIDLNGNCCNNAASIYAIPSLTNLSNSKHKLTTAIQNLFVQITQVESKIHLYQNSWFIPSMNDWITYTTENAGLRDLVSKLSHSGIGVLSYMYTFQNETGQNETGSHAVVAYGKPIPTSSGYKVALYDNAVVNKTTWLYITTSASGWTGLIILEEPEGTKYESLTQCRFQTDLSVYSALDYDGNTNATNSAASASNTASNLLQEYTILEVQASDDFTITNAQGQTLSLETLQIIDPAEPMTAQSNSNSAYMPVYGWTFIPYGEGSPCVYLFLVDDSAGFTCATANSAGLTSFYARNAESSGGAAEVQAISGGATITVNLQTS